MPEFLAPIDDGRGLVEAFQDGQALTEIAAARRQFHREARARSQALLAPLDGLEAARDDSPAVTAALEAGFAEKAASAADQRLQRLNQYAGDRALRAKVVVENISQGRPIEIYGRDGRRIAVRHRAAGTIARLDLAGNEMVVKPHWFTFRGIVRDEFRVAVVGGDGEPMVDVRSLEKQQPLKRRWPALSQRLARATS